MIFLVSKYFNTILYNITLFLLFFIIYFLNGYYFKYNGLHGISIYFYYNFDSFWFVKCHFYKLNFFETWNTYFKC